MSKKQGQEPVTGRYVWRPTHEAVIVGLGMRDGLAKGLSREEALVQSQLLLPVGKRLKGRKLKAYLAPSNRFLDNAMERASRLSPEQIRALLPNRKHVPEAAPPHDEKPYVPMKFSKMAPADYRGRGTSVILEDIELALLARRIDHWISLGSNCSPVRLMQEAQEVESPPERRRPRWSIAAGAKRVARDIERGRQLQHLIADIPFDPTLRHWVDPTPRPQEAPQQDPAPIPQAQARSSAQEPSSPLPDTSSDAHEEARVIGISLANAIVPVLEGVLVRQQQRVEARLSLQLRDAMKENAAILAQEMTRLMAREVDRLLGGGGDPGEATGGDETRETPRTDDEHATHEAHSSDGRLKVDILGIDQGYQKLLVERKLNGHMKHLDLRFVDQSEQSKWTPSKEREIVFVQGKVPFNVSKQINRSGCRAMKVPRSVEDVVTAITSLLGVRA